MKSLGLNLKDAKKVATDGQSSTFQLGSGHQIKILHAPLSALHRKQIEKMPVHKFADGGDVPASNQGDPPDPTLVDQNGNPPVRYDGMGRNDNQIIADQNAAIDSGADRAPASWTDSDKATQEAMNKYQSEKASKDESIGNAIHKAWDWVTSSGTPSGTPAAQTLLGGLTGTSAQAAPVHGQADLPAPSKDLPDMGSPVGASSSAQSARTPGSAPSSNAVPGVSLGGAYKAEVTGIDAQQQAESDAAQARLRADKMYNAESVAEQANWETEKQAKQQEIQSAIDDVKAGVINPKHYQENMSVGSKIASAIGMILGGASSSVTGHNPAAEFLNAQIDRDINAQKQNQNTRETVLGAYQDKYKNSVVAEKMTQAFQLSHYASMLQQAADQSADPLAKARALQAKAEIQMKVLPLVNSANAVDMLNKRMAQKAANPQAFSQTAVDYPAMNALQKTGIMPQQDVEAATKEAAQAEEMRSVRSTYAEGFKELSKKSLAGALTPGDRAAIINATAARIEKLGEGRYNHDAVVKTVEGMYPAPGDLSSTNQDKFHYGMKTLQGFDSGTPTLNRYGLRNPEVQQQPNLPKVGQVMMDPKNGTYWQYIDAKGNKRQVSGPNG